MKDVQNLIKFIAKSGVSEVKYKTKDFEINVKTGTSEDSALAMQHSAIYQIPTHATTYPQISEEIRTKDSPQEVLSEDTKYITINSPIIGTFYRKPSPEKDEFVNVGDSVSKGSVVCVIEAMKLFNQIESEVNGKIVKILVEDASPVEYDQALFLIDPL